MGEKIRHELTLIYIVLSVVIGLSGVSSSAFWCPPSDLDGDCWVTIDDLKIFTEQWLTGGECENDMACANFDGISSIDFADFAFLADNWQSRGSTLFINEFLASNTTGLKDPQGEYEDWIEIYNFSDTDTDLAGMSLTDDLTNPTKWQIPSGYPSQTTIPANGYLVFFADQDTADGPLHADFKLSASGEEIGLFAADGVTPIDTVVFGEQAANISYGRFPDGDDNWRFFPTPTPGAANEGGYLGEIDEVEFSTSSCFFDFVLRVTLACATPDVTIYYTKDGSRPIVGETPGPTSIQYTTPIAFTSSKSISAAAIKTGWKPSPIKTNSYLYSINPAIRAMPAVMLTGDPANTFYEPNGIMAVVGGTYASGAWQPSGYGSYNNVIKRGIAYERPVLLEIMDRPADCNLQVPCGIRIHGSDYTRPRFTRGDDWSCNKNKISFNLFFRDTYGPDRFDYPFFPMTPEVQQHKSIVLRAGMNDICAPFVKDEWMRRLFKEMGGAQETGTFANLYINGSYKSYFNPTGRADKQFYQECYGTDNGFDIIAQGEDPNNPNGLRVRDGNDAAFVNLGDYIADHNLADTCNYYYFDKRFDIPMFIDYLILQIYSSNFDWPNNNYTVHRERSETGKFRYTVWDAEGIESYIINQYGWYVNAFEDMPTYQAYPKGLNNLQDYIPRFYRALKANPNFRQLWADRTHRYFHNSGILTKTHLTAKWNEVYSKMSALIGYPDTFIPSTFIPNRELYVLLAFENNGLFTRSFGAPVFKVNGSDKFGGYVSSTDTFTILDPCASGGTIYYTTDGSDPRMPSGGTQKVFVPSNASKKVLVPTSNIGTTWRDISYSDTSWTGGIGGVGYERGTDYEQFIDTNVGSAMYNTNTTCYVRIPFTLDACDVCNVFSLTLNMIYDDGFIAYLNGTPVASSNAPASPAWNSAATANKTKRTFDTENLTISEDFNIIAFKSSLRTGTNILAIQGLSYSGTATEFLIRAELTGIETTGIFSPTAIQYTGGFYLNKSTNLRSRIYKSSTQQWSPLNEAAYEVGNLQNSVRVTELMYNPQDTNDTNDSDTEYVELKNIGTSAINLNLVKFDKGINFTFGPDMLAAGQYILVVKNRPAFEAKYGAGCYIAGQYTGSLDNGGEQIRLLDAVSSTILDFNYSPEWRKITDGNGFSLTIINPADSNRLHWSRKDAWRASAFIKGSPGWDDSGIVPNPGSVVINEVMTNSPSSADWIELYNTTNSPINIGGWYLSDSDTSLMKYRFATGTTIPANGYISVNETANFGNSAPDPGRLISFALSENGEAVCLTSALDANSNLTSYREKEDFGASAAGVSFGRYYKTSINDYDFVAMDHNTPLTANAYSKTGPIVISEIMYHPEWPAGGTYVNNAYEYIELQNISGAPVTLYDSNENMPWKFTNGINYTFGSGPNTVTITPGAKILVVKNPAAFSWRFPSVPTNIIYGPYSGWLSNDGEKLELSKPGKLDDQSIRHYIRVEMVNYSDGSHPGGEPGDADLWPKEADGLGKSLTRTSTTQYGNDPNNWTAAVPTPGS
jgi:hypothetical protein